MLNRFDLFVIIVTLLPAAGCNRARSPLSSGVQKTALPEIKVTKDTPPVFMVIAHGDKRFAPGNAILYLALAKAGASAELHVFAKGGHGFGMKKIGEEVEKWPTLAGNWMRTMGFLEPAKP